MDKTFEKYKEIRRKIHKNPEIGFEEFETANLIKDALDKLGIDYSDGICKTGIVCSIDSGKQGKCLIIRTDMDALFVNEVNEVDYKSQIKGKMHACGHDVHIATLLMAADLISKNKDKFTGCIKLVFQPAEETTGGAMPMIEEGILNSPRVDYALGFHVDPDLDVGKIIAAPGPQMASPDDFYITLEGNGGHCATPQKNDDLILASSYLVHFISEIDKSIDSPAIVKVCTINSEGQSSNVMPSSLNISGSFRSYDQKIREKLAQEIENSVKIVCNKYGIKGKTKIDFLYPPLINDAEITIELAKSSSKILGEENVIRTRTPSLLGEDFAYFSKFLPSSYFYLGAKLENHPTSLHSPDFDVDEKCIEVGAKVISQFVFDFLK